MKRLSSGLIESFNRKPKDMKRLSRGYTNFSHMRNRLLFATRTNPPILGVPKSPEEIKTPTGKKRGSYAKATNLETCEVASASSDSSTFDEELPAANILRSMLDDAQAAHKLLQEELQILKTILKEHDLLIPDHASPHDDLPIG